MTDYYEIRHTVGFEETNLVGNVYYVNYVRWQGRCREMFLKDKAPAVLQEVREDLKLFTIRLRLEELTQTQIQFAFDYVHLLDEGGERLVARGRQRIACMRGPNNATVPSRVPEQLREALVPYSTAAVNGKGA
jgi:enediyne biosynthesis thioesterase